MRRTFRNLLRVTCVTAGVLATASCDEKDALGIRRVAPEAAKGDAVIRGRVVFRGVPPELKPLKNEPCHPGSTAIIPDETVIVGPDSGLQNVFVYIEGGPMVDGRDFPPVMLDQVDCRYVPHAVGVVVGQTLRVKSSDSVFHNTHYTPERNPADNFGLLRAGAEKQVRFIAAEVFRARCDVHPWMSAQIGVFDNPFFDVSTATGAFELRDVPDGSYTIVARHELYGELRKPIEVRAGESANLELDYVPPGK